MEDVSTLNRIVLKLVNVGGGGTQQEHSRAEKDSCEFVLPFTQNLPGKAYMYTLLSHSTLKETA